MLEGHPQPSVQCEWHSFPLVAHEITMPSSHTQKCLGFKEIKVLRPHRQLSSKMDGAGEKVGVDPQRADAERLRRKSDIVSCRAGKLTLNWIGASFLEER